MLLQFLVDVNVLYFLIFIPAFYVCLKLHPKVNTQLPLGLAVDLRAVYHGLFLNSLNSPCHTS